MQLFFLDFQAMRKRFHHMNCSVARALDLLGEWWTILIIREALAGTRRFEDFQQRLGIARNILTSRLRKLTDHGVLERVAAQEGGRRKVYRLTRKGRDLLPVLVALMQWGDRWITGPGREPLRLIERSSGLGIARMTVQSQHGRALGLGDLKALPGPGFEGGESASARPRAAAEETEAP